MTKTAEETKIRLGVSTCLLGEHVRYDGGHKRDRFLTDVLGQYVDFVPVCPEYELGLGVPREAMRLVGDPAAPRLVTIRSKVDHTDDMIAWSRQRVKALEKEELCGFVFKSKSPSSGMERVKIYNADGMPTHHTGRGLFADIFMAYFPLLPVEDEGRLHDMKLRENFIERIFVYRRWRDLMKRDPALADLMDFHGRHKLLIMAHTPRHATMLGQLAAGTGNLSLEDTFGHYETLLQDALQLHATVNKNVNVLHHALGYFKKQLSADEKQEMLEIIDNYHKGYVPLIVPITLVNHFVRKYHEPYLATQWYLNPHPIELQLRNHV